MCSVKSLLHKSKDPGMDLHCPWENPGVVSGMYLSILPDLGRQRQDNPLGLSASPAKFKALSSTRDSLRHKCVRAKAAAQMVVCLPSMHEPLGLNSSIVISAACEKSRPADPGSMVILSHIATSLKGRKSRGEQSRKAPIVDFWLPAHTCAHA